MLTIHRSERADALVDALVRVVAVPLDDPFTPEVVAVPTRGVERWLTHRLGAVLGASPGRADGVCANVEFPFPGRLVGDVLAQATDVDRDDDPWRAERLVWPVLDVLDRCIGEPWCDMLTTHLGAVPDPEPDAETVTDNDLRRTRRFATARHVADLFDTYGVHRPAMVLHWLAGGHGDGAGGVLPDDARWQAELLRRVRAHVDTPSPPERVADACARLRAGDVVVDLPDRISLFGLTRLPATYLEVLRALAVRREVHLFALHPSLALWDRMATTGVPDLPLPRAEDPTRDVPSHPLLRTWARDTREMQLVLAEAADADTAHHPLDDGPPGTLLERIQADVRADAEPPGAPLPGETDQRAVVAPDDRSLQVHACHGRARQVEVLRDAICHLLVDDPSLEPRDVIVMCPDIDEFAPLLHATFGAAGQPVDPGRPATERGVPALPYRLADRSLRQTNPLLGALADLLHLVDSRLTAPDVVDFAGREPVRARFGFDDRALERVAGWIASSGIRWGLDADRRAGYWLAGVEANTWRAGLDRILLGVTMDEDGSRLVGGRLPLDDVDSGDVDLAGRFAELIDRIDSVATRAARPQPVTGWSTLLGDATDLLFDTGGDAAWQRVQVDRVLRDVVAEATADGTPAATELSLAEVRALLADRLRGVPTRADFRTGAITMCTLVPMRAVPHRVVCVLGLDDGAFPRAGAADGDDLLRRVPMVGDRDPRAEDRQLLLDAVLAAQQHLVITYAGRDERTNEPRPPAVPLSELLDVVHRTARTDAGTSATEHVCREHPLQPFDPRCFEEDDGRRWGFDRVALAGARAVGGARLPAAPFLDAPLPPDDPAVVSVDDLVRFVQHPIREFLRQRLGLNVWEDDDELDDGIPVELDGLQRWAVGQRMLDRVLAGDPLDAAVQAELARGALPPGAMGVAAIGGIQRTVEKIHMIAGSTGVAGPSTSLEIDVECGPVLLAGTVAGLRADVVGAVSFSSIAPKHRLAAWVRLLAVTAAHPDTPWRAVTIGRRNGSGRVVEHRTLDGSPSVRAEQAGRLLSDLLDLRRRGMQAPLPLPCATAEAWASRARAGKDARAGARDCWETTFKFEKEDLDRSHRRVYGGVVPFDRLLEDLPGDDEAGAGWAADETSRFGRLARRLWDPLLDHEVWR